MERSSCGKPRRPSASQNDTGIHLSNSTATQFLGGRRKSWMQSTGGALRVSSAPSGPDRPYPTPANSVDMPIGSSCILPPQEANASSVKTGAASLSCSEKPPGAPGSSETQPSSGETALLSSGATVSKGRNNDPQTAEQPGDSHARPPPGENSTTKDGPCGSRDQSGTPAANSANESGPPTIREPQDQRDGSINNQDAHAPSLSDARQNKRRRVERPLAANPSRGQGQVGVSSRGSAPESMAHTLTMEPSRIHSQPTAASPTGPPENTSTAQGFPPCPMADLYRKLAPQFEGWKASLPQTAQVRVCLLQEACALEDSQYFAFQQVYCLSTVSPKTLRNWPGFLPAHHRAFEPIARLLCPNPSLPHDFVKRCANLPGSIEAVSLFPTYRSALDSVLTNMLERIATRWDSFERTILSRGFPPLIDEIIYQFGSRSPIVTRVMFLACARRLTGNRPGGTQVFEEIYEIDRSHHLPRTTPRQVLEAIPENEYVLGLYSDHLLQQYKAGLTTLAHPPVKASPSCLMLAYPGQPSQPSVGSAEPEQCTGRPTAHPGIVPPQRPQSGLPTTTVSAHPTLPSDDSHPTDVTNETHRNSIQGAPSNHQTQLNSAGGVQLQQNPLSASTNSMDSSQPRPPGRLLSNAPANPSGFPMPIGGPAIPTQTPQGPGALTPLLPPAGYRRLEDRIPLPNLSGLHEAHLIVSNRVQDQLRKDAPSKRLHQCPDHFAVSPFCLGNQQSNFFCTLDVPQEERRRLARILPAPRGQRPSYALLDGSNTYQLRCIRVDSPAEEITREKWFEGDCSWPEAIYIHVNGTEHYVRRKTYNGKDLPVNITCSLREGPNQIKVTYLRGPTEFTKVFYAVAVEVLATVEHQRLLDAIHRIPAAGCIEGIKRKLDRSEKDDDELSIVGDHLTIDLIDPFTARICNIPVRSRSCMHWDCFDLETYLTTRLAKTFREAGTPEIWKCPICQKDARPQRLFVNEFLIEVRAELEKRNLLNSTKAILVKRDGTWQPKMDTGPGHDPSSNTSPLTKNDTNDSERQHRHNPSAQSSSPDKHVPVIELE